MNRVILRLNLAFYLAIVILSSCQPEASQTILADAKWITDNKPLPESDSLFYGNHPAPLFRTGFHIPGQVKNAELLITAAGYYETWMNGQRAGDQYLDPAWTDFGKRIYLTRLDVTELISRGENSWVIMTGNGFYNPLPLRMWGGRNLREALPVGKPAVIASLKITLRSGRKITISTSDKWLCHDGPVIKNSVYLGEWFDARKDMDEWAHPGASLESWNPVQVTEGPGATLEESFFPPIRITKWVSPISTGKDLNDNTIVDFGQNLAGLIRIKIKADEGDTIRFRYGERIYSDGTLNPMTAVCGQIKRAGMGGPGAPPVAEQLDVYIAKGAGAEFFQPRFTFHGFRYVEISGLEYLPERSDIQAGLMNTDVSPAGRISGSSEYLDHLNEVCKWTFLSNLFSVQSDCPAREKFGYGGDINATAEAYIYNFNMQAIYRKMIHDWVDAMKPDGFIDTAPFVGIEYCGISWESAFLFLQDWLLIHYNDIGLVRELYETDRQWMLKAARLHPDLIVDKGLSDHESLLKVPVELTGTCHYLHAARVMERFSETLGKKNEALEYHRLADNIRDKIADLFWYQPEIEVENKQTLLACLLYFDVLPPDQNVIAVEQLVNTVEQSEYHVTTGIFGTKYLLDALSSNGQTGIAYKMVTQPGFPGWKHMLDQGATTLWETWKESDNTYSQNHPMFGSVSEWYHKWLGGIQPDHMHPGTDGILFAPQPVEGLDSVIAVRSVPSGRVISKWKRENNQVHFFFDLPGKVEAVWIPPAGLTGLTILDCPKDWTPSKMDTEQSEQHLGKGSYHFVLKSR